MGFVKYTEYKPIEPPGYQEALDEIVQNVVRKIRESVVREGVGRAVRGAHGKSYGLAKATVTVPELNDIYGQGVFAAPGRYDAVVRFSNGLGRLRADALLGPACGMGIKVFGVPGASLLADEAEATTFDLNLMNSRTFFANTVQDYVVIDELFSELPDVLMTPATRNRWLGDLLTRKGTLPRDAWLWDELMSIMSFAAIPWKNLLTYTYNSVGAFRHGDYIAKLRSTPTQASLDGIVHGVVDPTADAEAYRNTLIAEAAERDHGFELQAQLNTDLTRMPVDNTSVEWPESLSPWVTVARIEVPRQDISDEHNLEIADATSITPWRVREEHRPLGEIQRVREEVYRQSSIERHRINGQQRHEPTSSTALLG
ncbi:catalase family protein [Streptomyces albipurpureus]|uniref:Catalase family protein n=1 Tax=Streptomyces albipurpureus TaxID=2897419 RepID=A0ABT0UYB8_9ACTN|nr:catalase family protein [Streptomyces sp. CWNU-1]MCM2393261.1 catalase family protein [Streptomyces sp. CWNU-1]